MGCPYKALADDTRRMILQLLSKSDTTAGEIADKFDISKPAISNHLKILVEAELITVRKDKQLRIYSIKKVKIKEIVRFVEKLLYSTL